MTTGAGTDLSAAHARHVPALEPVDCLGENKRTHVTALRSRALLVKERSFFLYSAGSHLGAAHAHHVFRGAPRASPHLP